MTRFGIYFFLLLIASLGVWTAVLMRHERAGETPQMQTETRGKDTVFVPADMSSGSATASSVSSAPLDSKESADVPTTKQEIAEEKISASVAPVPVAAAPILLPNTFIPNASVPPVALPPVSVPEPSVAPVLPPLDMDAIFAAVVKIECPSEDRRGKYAGSGFVIRGGTVVSAAHLLMASGSDTCTVIFPNKSRAPAHWLVGTISEDRAEIRRRHDEEGIDVATIILQPLSEYPEARAVFPDAYPSIPYPVCENPDMIGDALMHFGYPSNFLNQSYLSKSDGTAIAYADIKGIETLLNQDQTDTYRSPIFSYLTDRERLHPYMASRVPSFYGDSGGLAFNATKQCVLGPQRGGTIGGGAGENISIFPLLGWSATKTLLP